MKLLQITMEHWDRDITNKVYDLFKYKSYISKYRHSIVPPDKIEFIMAPLSDIGVENWLYAFNKIEGLKYTHVVLDYKDRENQ